jgi:glyoxylase-like metal-dependent hydrolase (beta-lactamase superfamily II)
MLFAGDDNNALVWLFLEGCTPLEIYLKSLEKLKLRVHEFTVIYPGHNEPLDAGFLDEEITCCKSILDGTGKTERYSSSAGDAMLGVFKRARIAFDPDNLFVKR